MTDDKLTTIRGDLATVRQTIRRAIAADDADLERAIDRLEHVLSEAVVPLLAERRQEEPANYGALTMPDVVSAREMLIRATQGQRVDLEKAAGLIDRALESLCPHDPEGWYVDWADSGEELVTCYKCQVSWYTGKRYGEGEGS